ncbi:hypothetical protein [Azospirillum sp.]|uniref:hypothetical protein n=1 Tax=Azospirillum sp. TaxID=34012 RepID=UPI002D6AE305|nr:hypothetical protein [Azospirillum sp.]HYD64641.1 hypothetical protein [Azospirillum sp.]
MMPAPPSLPLLAALLDAERALGRLAEAMRDGELRARLWADAARREAFAGARLDGVAVDPTDFMIATLEPDLVPTAGRSEAQAAHALWLGARTAQGERAPGPAAATETPVGAAAAAWQAVADLESLLAESLPAGDEPLSETDGDGTAPAWTPPWLEGIWRATQTGVSGRDPARLAFSDRQRAEARALLRRADDALGCPALYGGVLALDLLLRPPADPAWAAPLARLIAPAALARACRVPEVWLPASPTLLSERTGMRLALSAGAADWQLWLANAVAEAAHRERRRAAALDQAASGWRRRVGARRSNSRLPDVLDFLFTQPALTVRRLQQHLDTTFRGAQLMVDELVEAGILREVTQRALDRVFVAVELMP